MDERHQERTADGADNHIGRHIMYITESFRQLGFLGSMDNSRSGIIYLVALYQ